VFPCNACAPGQARYTDTQATHTRSSRSHRSRRQLHGRWRNALRRCSKSPGTQQRRILACCLPTGCCCTAEQQQQAEGGQDITTRGDDQGCLKTVPNLQRRGGCQHTTTRACVSPCSCLSDTHPRHQGWTQKGRRTTGWGGGAKGREGAAARVTTDCDAIIIPEGMRLGRAPRTQWKKATDGAGPGAFAGAVVAEASAPSTNLRSRVSLRRLSPGAWRGASSPPNESPPSSARRRYLWWR
jgi:hypothetical protein